MISRFLLLLLAALSVIHAQVCTLPCNDRGTCKFGNANTTGLDAVAGDDPANSGGMSCDCEVGFSGVQCERTTQFCDGSAHVCVHNGTCVKGEIQATQQTVHVCDCRNATEAGIKYVGLHCEKESPINHPTPSAVPDGAVVCQSASSTFCLHEGTCNANAAPGQKICNCPAEYTGYHCEFSREGLHAAGANTPEATTPGSCSVTCQNGGTCQVGYRNATAAELSFNSSFNPKDHVPTFEHCRCPEGTSGAFCEKNHTACGDLHCFHGSECMKNPQTNADYCNCKSNGTTAFAGLGCQHHSTTFCTNTQGLNGHQFCTNNGLCIPVGNQVYSCLCSGTGGFHGPHCEFPQGVEVPETHKACNLICQNGGKCAEGEKDGNALSIVDIKEIDHILNNTGGRNTNDYEHCICATGFSGDTCETHSEVCPGGQHMCFHKSTCVPDGEDYKCNCETPAVGALTAGVYCQHKATTVCDQSKREFCVNNGTCSDNGLCDCPSGFRGPHCEFTEKNAAEADDDNVPLSVPKSLPRDYKDRANETLIVSAAVVATLAIVLMIVTVVVTAKSGERLIEPTGPSPPPLAAFSVSVVEEANIEGAASAEESASKDIDVVPLDDAEDDSDHVNEII